MLTAPHFSPEALESVRLRIVTAARHSARDPSGVRLVAVSKQQPASSIRAACGAGQLEFGENYLQEALPKIESLKDLPLTWHFIGRLQANKTREVAIAFDWVHSVDRERIAQRLNDQRPPDAPPLRVLLQIRVDDATAHGGVEPARLPGLAAAVHQMPRLELRGLMCMPAPATDPAAQRLPFRRLRELRDELGRKGHVLDTLSMGMSADLEAAVAEGATMVRVGTAIFGPRT